MAPGRLTGSRYRDAVAVQGRSGEVERVLALEGACNFRDLGGYVGHGGQPLRWRRLFRADSLHQLTAGDLDALGGFGLRTVIDLRSNDEVAARGRIDWPTGDLAWHHLPMMDVLPPREEFQQWVSPDVVAEQYMGILDRGRSAVTSALERLADEDAYPAVYHCMAGKDRTGILTAVVLGLLGVSDRDIVTDYTLSKHGMERMLERLRAEQPDRLAELERSAAAIVASHPDTMAGFLERFAATYGSYDAYASSLGLDGVAAALRARLLEG